MKHGPLAKLSLLALLGLLGAPLALAPWNPGYNQDVAVVQEWNPTEKETLFLNQKEQDLQPGFIDPELKERQASFDKAMERFQDVDIHDSHEYEVAIEAVIDAYLNLEQRRGRKGGELNEEMRRIREWLKLR